MNSSRRPAEGLAVRPNYLAAETDQRTIVRRVQECRRILATPHLQRFIESEFLRGPAVQTDQQLPYFCPPARPARSITRPAPARWETPDGGGRSGAARARGRAAARRRCLY